MRTYLRSRPFFLYTCMQIVQIVCGLNLHSNSDRPADSGHQGPKQQHWRIWGQDMWGVELEGRKSERFALREAAYLKMCLFYLHQFHLCYYSCLSTNTNTTQIQTTFRGPQAGVFLSHWGNEDKGFGKWEYNINRDVGKGRRGVVNETEVGHDIVFSFL